ncbi:class I SAM-dependent methyltransferase [Salinisphaera sp.]|uniref:class I SAM-dependent methyltransferase n=1 Tax=Salinisphaera sp. TaxID=1914330 RepID=UPI002D7849B9|nr:class I SAM-dependent methyltransferase [Salinisphaera sp.]HET7312784.1 class I SAM-dependent methyltransferase [Salinisphaera sp.]
MSRRIDLARFETHFATDPDPWATWRARDEAVKRRAIVRALGAQRHARVLELASGNGSNSAALVRKSWRLLACDGSRTGAALTAQALAPHDRARARLAVLPEDYPRHTFDAIVIAELLYYLTPVAMARLAEKTAQTLRPGGRLVLAHHHITFHDAAQPGRGIHTRFLAATGRRWRRCRARRNRRWQIESFI